MILDDSGDDELGRVALVAGAGEVLEHALEDDLLALVRFAVGTALDLGEGDILRDDFHADSFGVESGGGA